VFTPQPVTLPDYIQNRIDHPESPEITAAYRQKIGSVVGPDAGKMMQEAQTTKEAAVAKVKADAIAEAAAYRKDAQAQQMEQWKVLRGEQTARDAAATAAAVEERKLTLTNNQARINALRDAAVKADDATMTGLRTDSDNGGGIIKRLQMLRSVEADMPESGSQFFQNHKELLSYFKDNIGLPEDQLRAFTTRELFGRLLTSLATQMSQKAAVGPGTARGAEIEQNIAMLPDLATDHEGRLLGMGFVQNLAEDQVRKAQEAEDYRYKTDHPDKSLELHQSLYKFDQTYQQNHPSIIPRAPKTGLTEKWLGDNVKPGMVYERWVPQLAPLTNQPMLDANRRPWANGPSRSDWMMSNGRRRDRYLTDHTIRPGSDWSAADQAVNRCAG
jgi:hypothetical protein